MTMKKNKSNSTNTKPHKYIAQIEAIGTKEEVRDYLVHCMENYETEDQKLVWSRAR